MPNTTTPAESIYNSNNVDQLRNLSGYSRVGFAWAADKRVAGYYSPENMSQLGVTINVDNNSFENDISNWLPDVPNNQR